MWIMLAASFLVSAGGVAAATPIQSGQAQLFVEIPNTVAISGLRRRIVFERVGQRYVAEDDFCVSARGEVFNLSITNSEGGGDFQLTSRSGDEVPFDVQVIDLTGGRLRYNVDPGAVVGPLSAPTTCRGGRRSTRLKFRVRVRDIPDNGTYRTRVNVMISGE